MVTGDLLVLVPWLVFGIAVGVILSRILRRRSGR